MDIKDGYKTTEFWRGVALYALAAYVIYKGFTVEQITDAFSKIESQVSDFKEMGTTLLALIVPMVDNMFYTKKRTELKEKGAVSE